MLKLTLSAIAVSLLVLGPNTDARAQPARVFVAAQGSDANPCTFASPCRTFQHAHDVAAAAGEIDVLDPAGYGSVIINKAISIQGHGFSGIGLTSGVTAITVNAGANDPVNLTGLLIEGSGLGFAGIVFNTGKSLTIENSIVRNVTSDGIRFQPSGSSRLAVSSTVVANVGGTELQ